MSPPNFRLLTLGTIALIPITALLDTYALGLPYGFKYYAVATTFEYTSFLAGIALGWLWATHNHTQQQDTTKNKDTWAAN